MIELTAESYSKIRPYLAHKERDFIFVFVHAVLDRNQPGKILVNNMDHPTAGLVISQGGKYYLFGEEQDSTFYGEILEFLSNPEHHSHFYDLYCSSDAWLHKIKDDLINNVVELKRSHYILEENMNNSDDRNNLSSSFEVREVNPELFDKYRDEVDFSYSLLWGSGEAYIEKAFGYGIVNDLGYVGACHTFYIGGGYIEPDILTVEAYRKQGIAYKLCMEFIRHSRERGLVPYWDCDAGNIASHHLARKLGFTKVGDLPILWWHENQQVISRYQEKYHYTN
ncbi:GNAT family N-acetyltransferase [Paenibacillus sp. 1001270B_150601_E10]|uniref:GNAT family N-acetyltransferase n=1 Tax=Paenibacillus sp. 1001270B_150601_E10 TaxID=2787079 RepID=UPI001E511CC1|nr:GNAT family N-acetyltransferase [Paenibacillus sp. 1001270B_150601_E10]